jgi:gliding motility-associated-like protein
VDFYDRLPTDPAAVKLGNPFLTPTASTGTCSDYEQFIPGTQTGKVFIVVNKDQQAYPNNYFCKDTATIYIQTFVKTGVAMPNAFSPNGDGKNDYFYVMGGLDIKKVKNLSVFNRYGQKIFEALNSPANDRQFGWNGRQNGKKVDFGTYVFFAAVEYLDGTVQTFKGTVIVTP